MEDRLGNLDHDFVSHVLDNWQQDPQQIAHIPGSVQDFGGIGMGLYGTPRGISGPQFPSLSQCICWCFLDANICQR